MYLISSSKNLKKNNKYKINEVIKKNKEWETSTFLRNLLIRINFLFILINYYLSLF